MEGKIVVPSIRRVLLICDGPIGDTLLATPAIHGLRRALSNARMTCLTNRITREILLNNPDIDDLLVDGKEAMKKIATEQPYDLTVNFFGTPRTEALSLLSGARYRLAFRQHRVFQWKNIQSYNIRPPLLRGRYDVIDFMLNLIRPLGLKGSSKRTRFFLTPPEIDEVKSFLKNSPFDKPNPIGIHPGGNKPQTLWKGQNFAALSEALICKYSAAIWIFQGPGEEDVARGVYGQIRQNRSTFLIPVLPLRKYASLVGKCKIFITHDRGPMHIAASLGVRTIGLFTSPVAPFMFPYQQRDGHQYLEKGPVGNIKVGEVLEKIEHILVHHNEPRATLASVAEKPIFRAQDPRTSPGKKI